MTEMAQALRAEIVRAQWAEQPPRDPASSDEYLALLRHLFDVGRRDLPLGRLLEGHVDAVQIVQRYGDDDQRMTLKRILTDGALLGVWNAALADEPLLLSDSEVTGGKSFASGAGVLTHALVTAETGQGPQLLLLDLARTVPEIDRDWWRTTGMQRSETHRVRWQNATISDEDRIGNVGDYSREPWFSGGALRFTAVHAGGVAGLCDRSRDHLTASGRAADLFQAARLAELFMLADLCAGAVRNAAIHWFIDVDETRLARIVAARLTVADAAERAMTVAGQAVGLSGHFLSHPLSALLADLTVYLRQPAPDAQRLRVGSAVADGVLVPTL